MGAQVGNAAPPDDLRNLIPTDGSADIVALCAQEATYSGNTAKESIIGTLTVKVLKAEGLRDIELFGGMSDPFCEVRVCSVRRAARTPLHGSSQAAACSCPRAAVHVVVHVRALAPVMHVATWNVSIAA